MNASTMPISALGVHRRLPTMDAALAGLTRRLYGRDGLMLPAGRESFVVRFGEVHAAMCGLQLQLRCNGFDFEAQVIVPGALADIGAVMSATVPLVVQRAAVMHALQPLWQAVQALLPAPLELSGLRGEGAAWSAWDALGMTIVRQTAASSHRTGVLLRALQPHGWQHLARAQRLSGTKDIEAANSWPLVVSVCTEPVTLSVNEIRHMEPGDVLLLKANARQRERLPVRLCVGGRAWPGVDAVLQGRKLRVERVAYAGPARANSSLSRTERPPMTSAHALPSVPDDSHGMADDLDAIRMDVEIQVARLSMPMSALRTLAAGQVLETQHAIDGHCVDIFCGGHHLGVGQLVAIGDHLGVRVVALESTQACARAQGPQHAAMAQV
ncbi:FliM/FliN family flagellar motor switch protein [Piscinibacter terrae]|uniref:Flagellar motor switch protein FliN-like C-terminal domain-containing protein n=1 Tax=Piscinibacter terrae TaxID=2496871 RepID=A0A3N7HK27_9BURK|nr:FliM/FliN family flagellar motor switch protein [Albitalea terrae]RQP21326.1 hypothetical protein DZC73_27905 [Albitalea terrae]